LYASSLKANTKSKAVLGFWKQAMMLLRIQNLCLE